MNERPRAHRSAGAPAATPHARIRAPAGISAAALALGSYLVVRQARLSTPCDRRSTLPLQPRAGGRGPAGGGAEALLEAYERRGNFEAVLVVERANAPVEPLARRSTRCPTACAHIVAEGQTRLRANGGRGHALSRDRRPCAAELAGRGVLLLLRGGPLERSRRASQRPARGPRRRRFSSPVSSAGCSPGARSRPSPGERCRARPRRGAPRHAASRREQGRVRRLGLVLQRDGRGSGGEDHGALGGPGA